jgi:hypothetical protein
MDLQRPLIDQVSNTATNAQQTITTGAKNAMDSVTRAVGNVRDTLGEFSAAATSAVTSDPSTTGSTSTIASDSFLDLNGTVAKLAFLLLVLFGFMALLRIGIGLVGYFTQNSRNPYVIKGLLNGGSHVVISQDPAIPNSVPIPRSNDAKKGAEFTWSTWLFIDQAKSPEFGPVFIKGEGEFDSSGIRTVNGPGMYLRTDTSTTLRVVMDTVGGTNEIIDVPNMPQQKWVHVAVRLQNTVLAIYVNGVIAKQITLGSAPAQNYYDVHVFPNKGVSGSSALSDLRYYDSALSVFGINNVVIFGPNKKQSSLTTSAGAVGGNYTYLSNQWY